MDSARSVPDARRGGGLSRDRIVEAAHDMIVQDGLDALSLRRLAERLGVTATALYKHVASKRELLRCVASGEFERLAQRLSCTAKDEPPLQRLRRFARGYFDFARERPRLYPVLFLFPPRIAPSAGEATLPAATAAFMYGLVPIREAMEAGDIVDGDPLDVALTLWFAMHGAVEAVLLDVGIDRARENRVVDALIESVIAGAMHRAS